MCVIFEGYLVRLSLKVLKGCNPFVRPTVDIRERQATAGALDDRPGTVEDCAPQRLLSSRLLKFPE